MRVTFVYIFFLLGVMMILFNCQNEEKNPYRNIEDENAHYVGMNECKSCHWQVYETFIKTGMGQSWGIANKSKSAADFSPSKALVYDTVKDLYYKPYWDGDSLCILEYRLQGRDTVHRRMEKVSYIVGSGQHTNSHIININGYLHQAPITFYTQKGRWDLAPGFEKGMNSRFDRKIELECISCHNGYPEMVEGSMNKYNNVKLGIDCERCHGPGSIHVAEKKSGKIIDTSQGPDYSIVNPRRLSTEQQNNLCQRCHLQGIAVLNNGAGFFDFKPSQDLKKTMNIFMPSYSGSDQHMIMASHVERMKMSACYIKSEKMSCITCHNPHVSVKVTPKEVFINACNQCHSKENPCTENQMQRAAKDDNCLTCHMPKNGSIDIPHVAVTDHFIRKRIQVENKNEIVNFLGMVCYNNATPDARTRARAFLEFYERYEPASAFLDSANLYLKQAGVDIQTDVDADAIRAQFLKGDYAGIVKRVGTHRATEFKDAWTCYRIGESYLKENKTLEAIAFLKQAVSMKPLALDFQYKLGYAYLQAKQMNASKPVLELIVKENPKYVLAHSYLGYIYLTEQNYPMAKLHLEQAIMLDPDHVQTLINMAAVYYQMNRKELITPLLYHAMKLDPTNAQLKAMLEDLKK
ncbi:MAG: tetratricopeptide repeat protein [Chitinophagaceae bacterium]|nr:tetratricopeptide repeat protein [Chitinophagaceae bacterium]